VPFCPSSGIISGLLAWVEKLLIFEMVAAAAVVGGTDVVGIYVVASTEGYLRVLDSAKAERDSVNVVGRGNSSSDSRLWLLRSSGTSCGTSGLNCGCVGDASLLLSGRIIKMDVLGISNTPRGGLQIYQVIYISPQG
jgi:hypothetical protein